MKIIIRRKDEVKYSFLKPLSQIEVLAPRGDAIIWRIWESEVKEGAPFHTFLEIFYKNFKILVLSYNLSHCVPIFKKIHKKPAQT